MILSLGLSGSFLIKITTRKNANVDIFFVDLRIYMSLYIDLTNNNDFYNLYVRNHDTYVNSYL